MEPLKLGTDQRALTASGQVGVVMKLASGKGLNADGVEIQWFDYALEYFEEEPYRVEWEKGTMNVVLPEDIATVLIRRGWARGMTDPEVRAYNRGLNEAKKETEK